MQRVAIVGLGHWGQTLFPILKSLEDRIQTKIVSVCDKHPNNILSCLKTDNFVKSYSDFDQMLSEEKLDLLFITTSLSTHFELAKKSLDKNINTFVEKPFVKKVEEAEELLELASSKSKTLMVGHRLLYSPSIKLIYNNFVRGKIRSGTVFEAQWKNWGKHQTGGVHWDLACHFIAVINFFMNSIPDDVSAKVLSSSSFKNPENISIVLNYPNKVTAKIDVSWNNPVKIKEFMVYNQDGIAKISYESDIPLEIYDCKKSSKIVGDRENFKTEIYLREKFTKKEMNEMYTIEEEIIDFVECSKKNIRPLASAELAIGVVKTLNLIDADIKDHIKDYQFK